MDGERLRCWTMSHLAFAPSGTNREGSPRLHQSLVAEPLAHQVVPLSNVFITKRGDICAHMDKTCDVVPP